MQGEQASGVQSTSTGSLLRELELTSRGTIYEGHTIVGSNAGSTSPLSKEQAIWANRPECIHQRNVVIC